MPDHRYLTSLVRVAKSCRGALASVVADHGSAATGFERPAHVRHSAPRSRRFSSIDRTGHVSAHRPRVQPRRLQPLSLRRTEDQSWRLPDARRVTCGKHVVNRQSASDGNHGEEPRQCGISAVGQIYYSRTQFGSNSLHDCSQR